METVLNTIQNKDLARLVAKAPQQVLHSIKKASAQTGVNFAYLIQQASAESSFNPSAKAKTSSASGLYQFIESTWLSMVKKYGHKHGMGEFADKIGNNGKVADKAARKEILALRNDPEKASAMAAEFAGENKQFLESRWGGKVGSTELYFAHFMGAGGAAAFLKAHDKNPLQPAAVLFPQAAKANYNVFYDARTGRAKSLGEVYAFFDKKFDIKDSTIPQIAEDALQVAGGKTSNDYSSEIRSVVFTKNHPSYNSLYNATISSRMNAPLVPQGLVANPLEVMLLSQMDMPIGKKAQNM